MRFLLVFLAITLGFSPVLAQHQGHHGAAATPAASPTPYAGFQSRQIKALTEQQIADLKAGRGMGLALAAEMNGHPGPMHVLELGDRLALSDSQRRTMEALMSAMRRDAIAAGEALIAAEAELDRLFASARIDQAALSAQIHVVAQAHGEVRRIHLATHISARAALTPEQIAIYNRLRGYGLN